MASKAVFGLGNPGDRYVGTRHNLGAEVVRAYLKARKSLPQAREEGSCLVYPLPRGHLIAFPNAYMNLSGAAVADLARVHNLAPADCLVAYDDVDLPLGTLRLRPGGGDGGHNGVASVIEHLGTRDFPRLRLGIGRDFPPGGMVHYVLGRFSPEERERLDDLFDRAAGAIRCFVRDGIQTAMNRFNG